MPGQVTHEGNFDDSNDPLTQEWTRITDADMSVVWEGRSRDFNERLRNRWAAFTDDELAAISDDWLVGESHEHLEAHLERLASESKAELERRRGAAS